MKNCITIKSNCFLSIRHGGVVFLPYHFPLYRHIMYMRPLLFFYLPLPILNLSFSDVKFCIWLMWFFLNKIAVQYPAHNLLSNWISSTNFFGRYHPISLIIAGGSGKAMCRQYCMVSLLFLKTIIQMLMISAMNFILHVRDGCYVQKSYDNSFFLVFKAIPSVFRWFIYLFCVFILYCLEDYITFLIFKLINSKFKILGLVLLFCRRFDQSRKSHLFS